MDITKILIKDSTGKPSVTMTAFVLGFLVVNTKLLLSGSTVFGFTVGDFSGVDYAAAFGGLGAIYVLRRNKDQKPGGPKDEE